MSPAQLFVWLIYLAPVKDWHGRNIPISFEAAAAIAIAAAETDNPELAAARLFVLGAHEGAYRPLIVGDRGKSCGAWQCPCTRTPRDLLGQARLAVSILKDAALICPASPVSAYAAGRCVKSDIASKYEAEIAGVLQ